MAPNEETMAAEYKTANKDPDIFINDIQFSGDKENIQRKLEKKIQNLKKYISYLATSREYCTTLKRDIKELDEKERKKSSGKIPRRGITHEKLVGDYERFVNLQFEPTATYSPSTQFKRPFAPKTANMCNDNLKKYNEGLRKYEKDISDYIANLIKLRNSYIELDTAYSIYADAAKTISSAKAIEKPEFPNTLNAKGFQGFIQQFFNLSTPNTKDKSKG